MNHLFAIALGGAFGAVLRFLVSTGVYQWLGRDFPYGTLAVNILGSFLLGLLTEGLILNRVAFTLEYRSAILIGFIGAFTTFSTFSLETVQLLEQGNLNKAMLNIGLSVCACLLSIWLGLLCGRGLALANLTWQGLPLSLFLLNAISAFMVGFVMTLLIQKTALSLDYQLTLMVVIIGAYLSFSGLYILLSLVEQGHTLAEQRALMLYSIAANSLSCLAVLWLGFLAGKQFCKFF